MSGVERVAIPDVHVLGALIQRVGDTRNLAVHQYQYRCHRFREFGLQIGGATKADVTLQLATVTQIVGIPKQAGMSAGSSLAASVVSVASNFRVNRWPMISGTSALRVAGPILPFVDPICVYHESNWTPCG